MVKKCKKNYFSKIEISSDIKKFWKTCKPFLSKKFLPQQENLFLKRNDGFLITNESEIAEEFNSYFGNILNTLNITSWKPEQSCIVNSNLSTKSMFPMFNNHPSIVKIRENHSNSNLFNFSNITPKVIYDTIIKLKKGNVNTPLSILKLLADSCSSFIADYFNAAINNCEFPEKLKWADIYPVFKKGEVFNKENYRPISILPTLSKIFERIIFEQINEFFNDKFSDLLCGFRKGFSTQVALIRLLKKWQKCLDKKWIIGTLLIDLSKAYDCIQHDLLLAKLEAYGFSTKSLQFIKSYLKGRKQRVKINSVFSRWLEIHFGIPQGSILGPLLFNIFLNDIFLFIQESEICNFADDNTLFACDSTLDKVIIKLKADLIRLDKWFSNNSMVANPSKFQLMFLGNKDFNDVSLNVFDKTIVAQKEVELLGVTIDNKLSFSSHIKNICTRANNKLSAIIRLRSSLSIAQTKLLINAHVLSHFSYCAIVWMFCKKKDLNLINKVHKRALKTVYLEYSMNLENLLKIDNSCNIHVKHLQVLMTEIYKALNVNCPKIMSELFSLKDRPYNLRANYLLSLPPSRTSTYGTNSLIFKGCLLWNNLPEYIKTSPSLNIFKNRIKAWDGKNCSCRCCK